jgi:chalcone isomerase-like protein
MLGDRVGERSQSSVSPDTRAHGAADATFTKRDMRAGRALSMLSLVLMGATCARPAVAGECAGVSVPDAVSVDGKQLVLNGMGLREATLFKIDIYVAALYVEHRSADAAAIVNSEEVKQLRVRFVRNVSRDDMLENMRRGFMAGAGANWAALEERFNQLKAWMPALHSGDEFVITYRPNIGIDVQRGNLSLGPIPGKDYADVAFRVWLGDHPPSAELKRGLLGGTCD